MRRSAQLAALVLLVAVTTASAPSVPGAALVHAPLAIIEGGTVRTLPKGVSSRGGKVVVLRGKPDTAKAKPAPAARTTTAAKAPAGAEARGADRARSCACATGGSSSDVLEMRQTESGMRVVVIGPDGQARTRYVPSRDS